MYLTFLNRFASIWLSSPDIKEIEGALEGRVLHYTYT